METEKQLIEQAMNGDRRACNELYRFIYSLVKNQLYYCSFFGADSQEMAHDITVKVFGKLHTFNRDYKLKAWMDQVTKNALVDHYRAKLRKGTFIAIDENFELGQDFVDEEYVEGASLIENRISAMEAIIKTFTPGDKYIIDQYYFDNWSQKMLADDLNTSVSALNSKLCRIRCQLRKQIEMSKFVF